MVDPLVVLGVLVPLDLDGCLGDLLVHLGAFLVHLGFRDELEKALGTNMIHLVTLLLLVGNLSRACMNDQFAKTHQPMLRKK